MQREATYYMEYEFHRLEKIFQNIIFSDQAVFNGGKLSEPCSKCERQGHNLFYMDNTAQVRGGLRGTLGEE